MPTCRQSTKKDKATEYALKKQIPSMKRGFIIITDEGDIDIDDPKECAVVSECLRVIFQNRGINSFLDLEL